MRWVMFLYATVLAASAARAGVTVDSVKAGCGPGGQGVRTLEAGFDASGADKLVVVIGAEHGFRKNNEGTFHSMTYGGVAMTRAAHEASSYPTVGIFFLDDPGPAGDIVVEQGNHNQSPFVIYLLSGTAPGMGASGTHTTPSVRLTTTAMDAMVIVGIYNSGPDGGNGAADLSADAPLASDAANTAEQTRWGSVSSAHATVTAPGPTTYSFSGANPADVVAIGAAEFPPAAPQLPRGPTLLIP